MALGRISGPLLKENLLREGVNLAFENDLLYLDVVNSRIGIYKSDPQYELDVNGTVRAPQFEIANYANIANVNISGNTISSSTNQLVLGTADDIVYNKKAVIDDIDITSNVISTNNTNTNLELSPNGTGTVEIFADTNVYGNIYATGNIRADGNITIGDADTDSITINAEITSDIIPDQSATYALGSDPNTGGKQWADVWTENFYAGTVTTSSLIVDGIDIALRQGNIYYVAENGDDTYTGDHPNDPFGTIKYAMSQATAGDTIHVYPGVYVEEFPITIKAGVTLKGHSIRSVNIEPTVATQTNDAFLLNGESTIEDLTIRNFFSPGHAFVFAPGMTVTSRSPYIRNISVITEGSVTSGADPRGFDAGDAGKGAYLDGSVVSASSREAGCLFHSCTFITPGVDALKYTNGTRVEWLNCFTYFANKGLNAVDGVDGLKSAGQTALRVDGASGAFLAGETIEYYDTDGVTLLASGTIDSVDADGKFYINGKVTGFELPTERQGKSVTSVDEAVLDTAFFKFGGSSLLLNTVTSAATVVSNNDFGFGTDNFAVECFARTTNTVGSKFLFDMRANTPTDTGLVLYVAGGYPTVFINGAAVLASPDLIPINSFSHYAVTRSGGTLRLFVNGNLKDSATYSNDLGSAKPLVIGNSYASGAEWDGHIDEVRITKGAARYTSNFAVPSSAFTSDADTVLLLHFNGDDSSQLIEDDALQTQDIRFSGGETANYFSLADYTDFGGELRSIASACVYGNYGAYGDGIGVLMYLISQNFAYIGTGKNVSNDDTGVIQDNEVVEINSAKIRYSSVDHKGDFRVGDSFYVNQRTGEVQFTSADLQIETSTGISITTNGSTTNITGEFLDTGNLRISGNTIESLSGDIDLDSASGIVDFVSTGALRLPSGDTASRPGSPELGMIRYNTDNDVYEGYDGNWFALNGVYDLDLDSKITAELTPGANDGVLRFYVNGTLVGNVNENRLEVPRIEVDDISIDGNVIKTETTNTDLVLSANGTGSVLIDELAFKDSSITNITSNGITYFRPTGSGYFKIEGTGGFVVPVGNNVQRPIAAYREVGMVRFNTEQSYLEVWDGTSWVSVAGSTGAITVTAAENLAIEYVLILG